jgi:hypothetical protein
VTTAMVGGVLLMVLSVVLEEARNEEARK